MNQSTENFLVGDKSKVMCSQWHISKQLNIIDFFYYENLKWVLFIVRWTATGPKIFSSKLCMHLLELSKVCIIKWFVNILRIDLIVVRSYIFSLSLSLGNKWHKWKYNMVSNNIICLISSHLQLMRINCIHPEKENIDHL